MSRMSAEPVPIPISWRRRPRGLSATSFVLLPPAPACCLLLCAVCSGTPSANERSRPRLKRERLPVNCWDWPVD